MGEFLDQIMSGGPDEVPLADVYRYVPGLADDLADGADPVHATEQLAALRPRAIPAPHTRYGHLLFGVSLFAPQRERERAVRAVADVVGGAHGAPTLGNSLGDVPASDIARALVSCGFVRTADLWLAAVRQQRGQEAARVSDAMVWEIPAECLRDERAEVCIAIVTRSSWGRKVRELRAVDFSSFGERVTQCAHYSHSIPGVPTDVYSFERMYCGRFAYEGLTEAGATKLAAVLTAHCGPPRAARIVGIDE